MTKAKRDARLRRLAPERALNAEQRLFREQLEMVASNGLAAGATVITPSNVHEHYDFVAGHPLNPQALDR